MKFQFAVLALFFAFACAKDCGDKYRIPITSIGTMLHYGEGASFGFDTECADEFFQLYYGSTDWDGKGIEILVNYKETIVYLWREAKKCGGKSCGRKFSKEAEPGDWKAGDSLMKPWYNEYHSCVDKLTVINNHPGLYKKTGMYFEFETECMDEFYGGTNWDGKVLKGVYKSGDEKSGEEGEGDNDEVERDYKFAIKLYKNERACGGKNCARLTPPSKGVKEFFHIGETLKRDTDCVGAWSGCDGTCASTFEISTPQRGQGSECAEKDNTEKKCTGGQCVDDCGCALDNDRWKNVCGVDGFTYRNKCMADCKAVKIASNDPCGCVYVGSAYEDMGDYGYGDYEMVCGEDYSCDGGSVCMDGLCYLCPGAISACGEWPDKRDLTESECRATAEKNGEGRGLRLENYKRMPKGCYWLGFDGDGPYYEFNSHPKGGEPQITDEQYGVVCRDKDEPVLEAEVTVGMFGETSGSNVLVLALISGVLFGAGYHFGSK